MNYEEAIRMISQNKTISYKTLQL